VSFDIHVQWFDGGLKGRIPVDQVMNAFGDAAVESEPGLARLEYGESLVSELMYSPAGAAVAQVCGVTINRPCRAQALWEAIYELLALGNAVFFFPGSALYARSEECWQHVPVDMVEAFASLEIVSSAEALVSVLEAS